MQKHQPPELARKTMGSVQDREVAESAPTRLSFGVKFFFTLIWSSCIKTFLLLHTQKGTKR